MNVLAVLIFSAVLATVLCNMNGPPPGACMSLTPGHNPSTGTDPAPYEVTIAPMMFGPGDVITVTVSKTGATDFRGIIVQARFKSGGSTTPLGTFSEPSTGTKLMECTTVDSTWVHANPTDKDTVTAKWTAPADASEDMVFLASVVQRNDGTSVFYTGLTADLTFSASGGARDMTTMKSMTTATADAATTPGPMPWTEWPGSTTMKSSTADAGYLRASLICTGLALFAIALVGRRL